MIDLKQVLELEMDYKLAKTRLRKESEELAKARDHCRDVGEAQIHVQAVAVKIQQEVHNQVSRVVTRCLEAVFDDPYEFRIKFERKRGRTEAKLVFIRERNGEEMEIDPTDGAGGGVLDVAAFALRIACLVLQKPRRRRLLVLDEPFKFVSERGEYRQRVSELLLTLSKEMKIQIVLVTHDPVLQVGKIIELGGKK